MNLQTYFELFVIFSGVVVVVTPIAIVILILKEDTDGGV